MTLDEHIKRYDDRAKSIRNSIVDKKECQEVVELLRELKAYREAREEITRKRNSGQWSEAVVFGLSRAIHIIDKCIEEVNADDT